MAGLIIISCDILAALGTFLFGKYIFSDWVIAQIEKRPMFKALNAVITEEGILNYFNRDFLKRYMQLNFIYLYSITYILGWKIVVMLRLTPLPFSLISYFFSVSSINVSSNDSLPIKKKRSIYNIYLIQILSFEAFLNICVIFYLSID